MSEANDGVRASGYAYCSLPGGDGIDVNSVYATRRGAMINALLEVGVPVFTHTENSQIEDMFDRHLADTGSIVTVTVVNES